MGTGATTNQMGSSNSTSSGNNAGAILAGVLGFAGIMTLGMCLFCCLPRCCGYCGDEVALVSQPVIQQPVVQEVEYVVAQPQVQTVEVVAAPPKPRGFWEYTLGWRRRWNGGGDGVNIYNNSYNPYRSSF
jgi:hypothetical protein